MKTMLLGGMLAVVLGAAGPAMGVSGIADPGFESGLVAPWQTIGGFSFGVTGLFYVNPTEGTRQVVVNKEFGVPTLGDSTPGHLTNFLGVTDVGLASVIGDGDLADFADSYGSAIQQTFTLSSPSALTFDYNLFTLVNTASGLYPESVVAVLDGTPYLVKDTDTAIFVGNDGTTKWTGYGTFAGFPTLSAGTHTVSVAAVGVAVSAGFEADNFVTTAVPEPASLAVVALGGVALLWRRRRSGV